MLWHWAAQFATAGDVGRYTDAAIEDACSWDGEPGALVAALTAPRSRFLDPVDGPARLVVHDWHQHADGGVHKALARSCRRFATGQIPNLGGLTADEKARAVAAFDTSVAVVSPVVDPSGAPDRPPAVAVAVAVAVPCPATAPPVVEPGYIPVEVMRCPDCKLVAVVRQQARYADPGRAPGWVCAKPRGGCGTVLHVGERRILDQLPRGQEEAVARSVERIEGKRAAPEDPEATSAEAEALGDLGETLARRFVADGGHAKLGPISAWLAVQSVESPDPVKLAMHVNIRVQDIERAARAAQRREAKA